MKKILKTLLVLAILFMGLLYVITDHVLPYVLLNPQRVHLDITPEKLALEGENKKVFTKDSLRLYGYCISPKTQKVKTVMLLVHGVGACKEPFLNLAGNLSKIGVVSYLFDSRAHGESEGEFCTYGYYEKEDISKIIDLIKKEQADVPIGIWGNSMGGAIAIQAMENDKRIDFGIIESTFTSLKQIAYDYKKRMLFGLGSRYISNRAVDKAGEIANFNPDEVSPIAAVKNIDQPIFIAHGDADKNISYLYGQQLFDALGSTDKTFYLVKGGGHMGLAETAGVAYTDSIRTFISKQINQ